MFLQTISSGSQISFLSGESWRGAHQWVHRQGWGLPFELGRIEFELLLCHGVLWHHGTLCSSLMALPLPFAPFCNIISLLLYFLEEICKKRRIQRRGRNILCFVCSRAQVLMGSIAIQNEQSLHQKSFYRGIVGSLKSWFTQTFFPAGSRSLEFPAEQLSIWAYLASRIPVGKALLNSRLAKQSNVFVWLFVCLWWFMLWLGFWYYTGWGKVQASSWNSASTKSIFH